jgi:hypothetical protein
MVPGHGGDDEGAPGLTPIEHAFLASQYLEDIGKITADKRLTNTQKLDELRSLKLDSMKNKALITSQRKQVERAINDAIRNLE